MTPVTLTLKLQKAVREDHQDLKIFDDLWEDRVTWRARIHVANPDNFENEL